MQRITFDDAARMIAQSGLTLADHSGIRALVEPGTGALPDSVLRALVGEAGRARRATLTGWPQETRREAGR